MPPKPHAKQVATKSYVDSKIKQNVDWKMFQTDFGGAVGTTATVGEMLDVGTGDTYLTRDGNSIRVRKVDIRGRYNVNSAGDNATIRLIVFQWGQDDTPTTTDVLQDTSTRPNLSQVDFNNNRRQLRIVFDKVLSCDTGGKPHGVFHLVKSWKAGLPVRYISTGTSGMGKLYYYIRSDDNTNSPNCEFKAQVVFTD